MDKIRIHPKMLNYCSESKKFLNSQPVYTARPLCCIASVLGVCHFWQPSRVVIKSVQQTWQPQEVVYSLSCEWSGKEPAGPTTCSKTQYADNLNWEAWLIVSSTLFEVGPMSDSQLQLQLYQKPFAGKTDTACMHACGTVCYYVSALL